MGLGRYFCSANKDNCCFNMKNYLEGPESLQGCKSVYVSVLWETITQLSKSKNNRTDYPDILLCPLPNHMYIEHTYNTHTNIHTNTKTYTSAHTK